LTKRCEDVKRGYKNLLDMKQKEASVVEASCARVSSHMATKQGYAMMTFTVVTVLFLPLSFFTSLFGMNVRDWSGQASNEGLRKVLILMGSVSAAVIVLALLAAFFPLWISAKIHALRKKLGSSKTTRLLRRKQSNRAAPKAEDESETDESTDQEIDEESDSEDAEAYQSDNDESRVQPRSWRSLGDVLRFRRSTTSTIQA